ncbi:MAG: hypothetical protein EPN22_16810 [Nitrospirae bacterium]|nr:MAG: hypothetical protein EPN22_16810 [Nitrospirota bacterium]
MITLPNSNKILGYLLIQRLTACLLVLRCIQYLQKIQAKGNLTSKTDPNGNTTTYSYDTSNRLTNIQTQNSRLQTISSFAYTHDKVGNRLSKEESDKRQDYHYDQTYRLLQSLPTNIKNKGKDKDRDKEYEQKEENYSYDPVGNRLFGPKPIEFYSYNRGNQLTNDKKHQYEYDKNGNLVKKTELDDDGKTKVTVYTYDYENRLIKVAIQKEDEKKIVTFSYDPFGRRISKSLQYQSLRGEAEAISDDDDREKDDHYYEKPRTTYYAYDNEDIIVEYNGKGKIIARYTHCLGIDEPLAEGN